MRVRPLRSRLHQQSLRPEQSLRADARGQKHAKRVVSQRWNSDSPGRIASIIQEFCLGHSLAICAGPESPIRISILPVDRLMVRKIERGVKLTSRLHTAIG